MEKDILNELVSLNKNLKLLQEIVNKLQFINNELKYLTKDHT